MHVNAMLTSLTILSWLRVHAFMYSIIAVFRSEGVFSLDELPDLSLFGALQGAKGTQKSLPKPLEIL